MAAGLAFQFDLGGQSPQDTQPRGRQGGVGAAGGAMRLLLMGDFSGKLPAERAPLATRPTQRVDVDNLDAVLKRLAPRVTLPAGALHFEQLDDFHPDALFGRLDVFRALRQARAQPPEAGGDLLAGLLGGSAAGAPGRAPPPAAKTGLDALLQQVVASHILPDTSADQHAHLAAVDAAVSEQMRRVLHDPAFQGLEAAWRGVQWLIANLELDEQLQLHLFDVTREELLADIVSAQGQLAQTGLHRALAQRWRDAPDGESWSLLAGLYGFGPSDTDVGLLAALGLIASQAGGPFVAGGDSALAAAQTQDTALDGWQALRRSEAAPWLGLAAPRVLLRLPYGKRSDPVSAFSFEEFGPSPDHEAFLWGTPSLAVALLIGRAFAANGWAMSPGDEREIGDLPAYTFQLDGEATLQAAAEHYLPEATALSMLSAGLMPLLSHRRSNTATLLRMQSIAEPATALAGPWG